jgi:hypothetical protein
VRYYYLYYIIKKEVRRPPLPDEFSHKPGDIIYDLESELSLDYSAKSTGVLITLVVINIE